ncbi:MAG: CCA tRNA nucleotidyltransferase [Candidatus Hydrogenedentota bacterium]
MQIPDEVKILINKFNEKGFKSYLVGGCVRDYLMGIKVNDYDLATDATPDETSKVFSHTHPVGVDFGTVLVIIQGKGFEVTSFRKDIETDGRHAKVEFSRNLIDDLNRRDFTINAIAYDPLKDEYIDPFKGREDIKNKILQSVGDSRKRFKEDYLRILRGIRFAARFKLQIEQSVKEAISETKNGINILSDERIREEILKSLEQIDKPSDYFNLMDELSVLAVILPELTELKGVEQNYYHLYDCFTHTMVSIDRIKKKYPLLRLTVLLHDIAKPECKTFKNEKKDFTFTGHDRQGANIAKKIMTRLKFSKDEIKYVTTLIKNHLYILNENATKPAIRRYINRIGKEYLKDMFRFHFADVYSHRFAEQRRKEVLNFYRRIKEVLKEENVFSIKDLAINGYDLKDMGLEPSPLFSKILKHCLEIVLDNPDKNKKEILIDEVKKYLQTSSGL